MVNILFLGDVFGRPGRRLVRELTPKLVTRYNIDLAAANGENASGGLGLTIRAAEELFGCGLDVMTSGNHIFKHREIYDYLDGSRRLIRPANYPDPAPGRGVTIVETPGGLRIGVLNLIGRTYMTPVDCPFQIADRELAVLHQAGVKIVLVDFHAEATSEKRAMGWHLDGRVSAVLGTHTHVQTADEEVMPGGAAYITDAGMTGPHRSVIGMKTDAVLDKFLTGRPSRFSVARQGLKLQGVVLKIDENNGRCGEIIRICETYES